jgi:hypothetical protein
MQTNPENKAEFESISHERYVKIVEEESVEYGMFKRLTTRSITEHLRTSSSAA